MWQALYTVKKIKVSNATKLMVEKKTHNLKKYKRCSVIAVLFFCKLLGFKCYCCAGCFHILFHRIPICNLNVLFPYFTDEETYIISTYLWAGGSTSWNQDCWEKYQ